MHSTFHKALARAAAAILLVALAACATPPPARLSCPNTTAPLALQQAEAKGFNNGYRAGQLAQALRDQARARQEAAALGKSENDAPLFLPAITLPVPNAPVSSQVNTTPAGSAVPLAKEWLPF
jgi:hypothetical protein